MGGAISLWLLGALELSAMIAMLAGVVVWTRHQKTRMTVSLTVAVLVFVALVCCSQLVPTLRAWIYEPVTSLVYLF